jgi:TonB family protein
VEARAKLAVVHPTAHRLLGLLLMAGLSAARLSGQNLLYTEHEGQMHLVRGARGIQPLVKVGDKLVAGFGRKFILQKTDEFLPLTVFLRDVDVGTGVINVSGTHVDNSFHFRAIFEAPYELPNVFLVLELETKRDGKVIFLHEVGNLAPHESQLVGVEIPLTGGLGAGRYRLHVFSDGEEMLNSQMSSEYRDRVLDELIAKRVAAVKDSAPKLFVRAVPEYPAALQKDGRAGAAVIALRIDANGRVHDPAIRSASDPAFGEAAMAAMRLSRFLPRMQDGHPVEAVVEVPVELTPPAGKS